LTQMQFEDGNRYSQLNALACAIYKIWLDDKDVDGAKLANPLSDQIQADYIAEGFYHLLNCLCEKRDNTQKRIEASIEWYIQKLRSSFKYDKSFLQQNLIETFQRDEDIPGLLQELIGQQVIQQVLGEVKNFIAV